jgi:PEP-CTERM motif
MTKFPFLRRFTLVAAFAVSLPCLPAQANTVYSLVNYPGDQNGWTLSGSITTDGKTGALMSTDVLSWSWTVTSGVTAYTFRSTDPGAFFGQEAAPPDLIATSSALSVPFDQSVGMQDDSGVAYPTIIVWSNNWGSGPFSNEYVAQLHVPPASFTTFWQTVSPTSFIASGYVIATAAPTVPEPSTLTLLGTSLLGLRGFLIVRRRRGAKD